MRLMLAALLLAVGCGPTVSLDSPPTDTAATAVASSTSAVPPTTGTAESSASTTAQPADSGSSSSGGGDPAGGEACAPGCEPRLEAVWRWETKPPAAEPPDPGTSEDGGDDDPPPVPFSRFTALTTGLGNEVYVAEHRDTGMFVHALESDGTPLWSRLIDTDFCDCAVIDLEITPGALLAYTAFGTSSLGAGGGYSARVGLLIPPTGDGLSQGSFNLSGPDGRLPRVGPPVPLGGDLVGVAFIVPTFISGTPAERSPEDLNVFIFDSFGHFVDGREIFTQLHTANRHPPIGVALPDGRWAVGGPSFTGGAEDGFVLWLDPFVFLSVSGSQPRPSPPEALVVTPDSHTLAVAPVRDHDGRYQVSELLSDHPPTWQSEVEFAGQPGSHAQVALGPDERIEVALLTHPREAAEPDASGRWPACVGPGCALELATLSPSGAVVREVTVPLDADVVEPPIDLGVDWQGDLVLGYTADDRLVVEKRSPVCECE